MAAAKSLTPAELQTVLAYTATQPYAQRNRAMLMMTVAAGLRVSEVAGLTLGDILDSKGAVRGEVFLAAHRVKHQHARTIYINSRLQQELAELQEQQQALALSDPESKIYSRAVKMVELGADLEEIIRECELPRAEAELLFNLHRQQRR